MQCGGSRPTKRTRGTQQRYRQREENPHTQEAKLKIQDLGGEEGVQKTRSSWNEKTGNRKKSWENV